jgi:hypothetical protein
MAHHPPPQTRMCAVQTRFRCGKSQVQCLGNVLQPHVFKVPELKRNPEGHGYVGQFSAQDLFDLHAGPVAFPECRKP